MPLSYPVQTRDLINAIGPQHWRARLAIALLCERCNPHSFFLPYLNNLPQEIRGVPLFFSPTEFRMLQDIDVMQKTRDRCHFLNDFSENILLPLHKSSKDPFDGNRVDVNALGWGFACASSRAVRSTDVDEAVLIPGIDFASHSFDANCALVTKENSFDLVTTKALTPFEELTMIYGPLSNDDLLSDYGFTIDNNPFDVVQAYVDETLINIAMKLAGQDMPSFTWQGLPTWKRYWLTSLQLSGPRAIHHVHLGPQKVDGRLWALFRIMFAGSEEDLLKFGYDPNLLQNPGALLSKEIEKSVLRAILAVIAIIIRSYGTDESTDMDLLINGDAEGTTFQFGSLTATTDFDLIRTDCHRILRDSLQLSSSYRATSPLLDSIESSLSTNLKEALKYRIRRKRLLSNLACNIAQLYTQERSNNLASSENAVLLDMFGTEEKTSRSARIRELLDETRTKTKNDIIATASTIADNWSRRGAGL
eukprot:scaffold229_cov155-Ochromonas_danica.AAC.1